MNKFKLISDYKPAGDQPEAINQLVQGILRGDKAQTLLGVTGSGKTFTIANVIKEVEKPTLILSHNKTLAAQLYGEFKQFFPDNAVEYFVSYYDYYQPEAYIPATDTYIEKDLSINEHIEKMRLSTTSSLLSGRKDIIVVSSVSCIYGLGNPADFKANTIFIKKGQTISRNKLLSKLVSALYSRTESQLELGKFRVKGDTIDIYPAYADFICRIIFWGNEIESIQTFTTDNFSLIDNLYQIYIYPANIFVTTEPRLNNALQLIEKDLKIQVELFKHQGKDIEAKRLQERVTYDLEMMRELGYCPGIENYSRYFDGRKEGERPFCLLDYFPDDFLIVVDESHVTIPQIRAMYAGDRSRKETLVEYGFRLPAALDNRPLKFEEFNKLVNQIIYLSATPGEYEIKESKGIIVEQIVRPTGLIDPEIVVKPSLNQIDDLINEIQERIEKNERVLVTTLTKRMSEELSKYFQELGIKSKYLHSEIDTLDRVEIIRGLRLGHFNVLVGVNLLREGLDMPEVSLVAILDADKEGFLRSERSLTQTAGRAARNINGKVIFYADTITESMQKTIDETNRRRLKQIEYNRKNNITPKQIFKHKDSIINQTKVADKNKKSNYYTESEEINFAADPLLKYMSNKEIKKQIKKLEKDMINAAKNEDYLIAARIRDEIFQLEKRIKALN